MLGSCVCRLSALGVQWPRALCHELCVLGSAGNPASSPLPAPWRLHVAQGPGSATSEPQTRGWQCSSQRSHRAHRAPGTCRREPGCRGAGRSAAAPAPRAAAPGPRLSCPRCARGCPGALAGSRAGGSRRALVRAADTWRQLQIPFRTVMSRPPHPRVVSRKRQRSRASSQQAPLSAVRALGCSCPVACAPQRAPGPPPGPGEGRGGSEIRAPRKSRQPCATGDRNRKTPQGTLLLWL